LLARHRPELLDLLPLVNAVLPLDLPDNELTSQLSGQLRGENTRRLLLGILTLLLSREQPTVIVLDDGHWQDTASWALAAEVGGQADLPLLFVLAFRPVAEPVLLEYGRLLSQTTTHFLKLDSLNPEEVVELVRQRLEVTALPPVVKELIRDKADGSPFFSEELAYVLRDRGFITIRDGQCRLEKDGEFIKDWVAQNLPGSVEVVVTNRIDNLTPAQQLTIKTASVVGRTFLYRAVYDNFPLEGERTSLLSHLEQLEKLNITPLESGSPELTYLFRHAITHEVTYGLLLYSQRRRLHQAVAEWYESHYAGHLSRFYTLLAHHWLRAEIKPKALEYLEKCGEQSLQAGAYQETIYFYEQIFNLTAGTDVEPQKCAGWELNLGIAYQGLGRLSEAQPHLEKVLGLCNVKLPSGKGKQVAAILKALAQQVSYRTKVRRPPKPDKNRWLQIDTATKALVQLQEIYLHTNQLAKLLYSFNMRCNLAEQLQSAPQMAEGYFGMGMLFASMGFMKVAYKYKALADEQLAKVINWATLARCAENMSIYHFGIAEFKESQAAAERALDYYRRLGDKRQEGINISIIAAALFFQGKYHEAFEQWTQIYKQAVQAGDVQVQGWALAGQIRELTWLGELDAARQLLQADDNRMLQNAASASALDKAAILGPIIMLSLRLADYQTAREKSDELVVALKGVAGRTAGFLPGYTMPLEAYLMLWQKEPSERRELEPKIRRVAKQLQAFGRLFPIGKFYSLYYRAGYLHLKGEAEKALATAKKAMMLIQKLPAPYEQALAHALLARYLPPNDAERPEHLAAARRIFSELEAKWDLTQLEQ
jgi:tetratricopeptide (TPR) repeat protein